MPPGSPSPPPLPRRCLQIELSLTQLQRRSKFKAAFVREALAPSRPGIRAENRQRGRWRQEGPSRRNLDGGLCARPGRWPAQGSDPSPTVRRRPESGVTCPQLTLRKSSWPPSPPRPGRLPWPSRASLLRSVRLRPLAGARAQSTRGSCVLGPALGPRDPSALFWAGRLVAGCQSRRAPSRPLLVAPSPPLSTPAYDLSPSQNFLQTVFLKTISANPTEFAQRTAPGSVRNHQHGPAMPSASSVSASVSRVARAVLLPPACDSFSPLLTVALSLPDV